MQKPETKTDDGIHKANSIKAITAAATANVQFPARVRDLAVERGDRPITIGDTTLPLKSVLAMLPTQTFGDIAAFQDAVAARWPAIEGLVTGRAVNTRESHVANAIAQRVATAAKERVDFPAERGELLVRLRSVPLVVGDRAVAMDRVVARLPQARYAAPQDVHRAVLLNWSTVEPGLNAAL